MKKLHQCVIEHFLSIIFPPIFSAFEKNVDDDFMKKKSFQEGKRKINKRTKMHQSSRSSYAFDDRKKMINVTSLVKKSKTGFTAKNHKPYQTTLKFVGTMYELHSTLLF